MNRAKYLFDAATGTVHAWPDGVSVADTELLYSTPDEAVPGFVEALGAPPHLTALILKWRRRAGCFKAPGPAASCDECADHTNRGVNACESPLGTAWRPTPSVMSNLILVLTDDCNLRCKYCIFSGQYEGYKSIRRDKMSWETARRAVDRFLELNDQRPFRSIPRRKLDIAFFGGEPLLEGPLLRRVVAYARSKRKAHYNLCFSATTNLTHLPIDLAEFLVDNEVGLLVSMDGPQEVHDRYRRNRADGGTFDAIRRNLEKLYRIDKDYFHKHVRAVVTLTGNSDLLAIRDFFDSDDPLVPPIDFVGNIRDQAHGEFHEKYPADTRRAEKQYHELFDEFRDRKRRGVPEPEGSFFHRLFESGLRTLYERTMFVGIPGRHWTTGTCEPGRRIAVSTDGRFHLCERINEDFPIGDVERGFDLDRAASVLGRYRDALPDCDRCWARALCGTCYAQACDGGDFRVSEEMCDVTCGGIAQQLIALYTILEEAPNALSSGDPLMDRNGLLELPS